MFLTAVYAHNTNTILLSGAMVNGQYNIAISIISHYFIRWRDFAYTIVVLGSSVNLLVIPHLLTYFHGEYGFRGAILITGGIALNLIPAGMVLHPVEWHTKSTADAVKTKKSEENNKTPKLNALRTMLEASKANILLLKSPRAIVISLAYATFFSGTTFISSYVPFIMQGTGFTLKEAAYCITMIGVFHLVARFFHPFVSGAAGGNNFPILIASYAAIPASVVGKMIYLLLLIYVTYYYGCNMPIL